MLHDPESEVTDMDMEKLCTNSNSQSQCDSYPGSIKTLFDQNELESGFKEFSGI